MEGRKAGKGGWESGWVGEWVWTLWTAVVLHRCSPVLRLHRAAESHPGDTGTRRDSIWKAGRPEKAGGKVGG